MGKKVKEKMKVHWKKIKVQGNDNFSWLSGGTLHRLGPWLGPWLGKKEPFLLQRAAKQKHPPVGDAGRKGSPSPILADVSFINVHIILVLFKSKFVLRRIIIRL